MKLLDEKYSNLDIMHYNPSVPALIE